MPNFFVVVVDRSYKGQKELIFVRKTCLIRINVNMFGRPGYISPGCNHFLLSYFSQ